MEVRKIKSSSSGFFSKLFFSKAISIDLQLIAIILKNVRTSLQQYAALENSDIKLIKLKVALMGHTMYFRNLKKPRARTKISLSVPTLWYDLTRHLLHFFIPNFLQEKFTSQGPQNRSGVFPQMSLVPCKSSKQDFMVPLRYAVCQNCGGEAQEQGFGDSILPLPPQRQENRRTKKP